ncbi:MAG: putative baseplate assembly protein [Actinomycetota bacterium]|nr:putative baseplate assembly protein [Actinomycetota bacterium]
MTSPTGRRPIVDYLTKDYDGFREGMLGQIPQLLPAWTDRGENDFGVVLVELFAYVADILSYYQDRVANEAFLATATQRRSVTELLRLIGYQIDPGLAASAYLHIDVAADVTVPEAALPYRVATSGRPGEPDVTFEVGTEFTAWTANNAIPVVADALPAGTAAALVAVGGHALAEGHGVYLEERTTTDAGDRRVRRSPMLTVTRIRAVSDQHDEIAWTPPLPGALLASATVLKGNNVLATHGATVTDEPVFVSDGTPGQRFSLSRAPVTHLLLGGASRRGAAPEVDVLVDDVPWTHVETVATSGPADPHFTTTIDDQDVLTVHLGTGGHGAIPPAGAQVAARYRVGLGPAGNVGPDTLTLAVSDIPEITGVANPFAATGGAARESIEEARVAGPGSVIAQERAVTVADFELLAAGFPGVGKAKARVGLRGGYKVVQVYIVAADPDTVPPPPPPPQLCAAVKQHLEARMPINRMAGADVLAPVFVAIDATVEVHLKRDTRREDVVTAVENTLRDLLSFTRQEFGRAVRVGEVFSALYPIPGIDYVLLTRLQRADRPTPFGALADVPVAENELAYPHQIVVNAVGGR